MGEPAWTEYERLEVISKEKGFGGDAVALYSQMVL